MKRRILLLTVVLLVLGTGAYLFIHRAPPDPVYEGKRLSEWLKIAKSEDDPQIPEAIRVVDAAGLEALPWLLWSVERNTPASFEAMSEEESRLLEWNRRPNRLGRFLLDRAVQREARRNGALWALSLMGPEAEPSIERLIRSWWDKDGVIADKLVYRLKPAAYPVLIRAASDPAAKARRAAVENLYVVESHISPARPNAREIDEAMLAARVAALGDSDPQVRQAAVSGMNGAIRRVVYGGAKISGPLQKSITAALNAAMADPDELIRRDACGCLALQPEEAAAAVPGLIKLLRDPSPRVRSAAASSLTKIKGSPKLAVAPLRDLLEDSVADCRIAAAVALVAYGITEPPVIAELIADVKVHGASAGLNALASLGEPFAEPALRALFESKSGSGDRKRLAETFRRFGKSATPHLISALSHKNREFRLAALDVLDLEAPGMESALREIAKGQPDREMQRALKEKLVELGVSVQK